MKESQHTEWKESWRDDHLRWVCGFANAEGGVLVIGRNDKGRVVGVPDAARLLDELPAKRPESQPESQPESRPESLALRAMGLLVGGAMSKAEISAGLGHKEISGQLNRVIRTLLQERLVTYTIPAKPNSRLQKYILTEQGTKRLSELRQGRTSR